MVALLLIIAVKCYNKKKKCVMQYLVDASWFVHFRGSETKAIPTIAECEIELTECQLPANYNMRKETPLCIETGSESSLEMSGDANKEDVVCRKETPIEDFNYTCQQ